MKPSIPFANINPEAFLYDLPESRIAMFPEYHRDMSKLLIAYPDGTLNQDKFLNISNYLPADSTLFFNNSRVIPARLHFKKETGSQIEIFCLKPLDPADYAVSLASVQSCVWECMIGNMKRFNTPFIEKTIVRNHISIVLKAEKLHASGNIVAIKFSWNHADICFADILLRAGKIPLPPYIKRAATEKDNESYQTIFSQDPGSVAAPTAGLHFTNEVLNRLLEKGICSQSITLHVGAGTFQPVKAKVISEHVMHAEYFEVSKELLHKVSGLSGKVVSVGTTTVRTLESLYWLGVKILENKTSLFEELHVDQWDCYLLPDHYSVQQAMDAIDGWMNQRGLTKKTASTQMIIIPGYRFKITEILITNFHQPGSTLLLLIAAFMGDSWRKAYQYALEHEFRFLSYGDSSLLFRNDGRDQ
jgi:S-adenosylmethionine:tRNA ribosyltransferase-isomerase